MLQLVHGIMQHNTAVQISPVAEHRSESAGPATLAPRLMSGVTDDVAVTSSFGFVALRAETRQ